MIDPKLEKIIVAVGAGISGWYALSTAFPNLPSVPSAITTPFMGSFSVLAIAGSAALYSVYVWFSKY